MADAPEIGGPNVTLNRDTELFVQHTLQQLSVELEYSEEFFGLNFQGSDEAVVMNALVEHGGLYLALLRSSANDSHVGTWNNVAGYMQGIGKGADVLNTLQEELASEASLDMNRAHDIKIGSVLEVSLSDRRLYVVPALVHFAVRPTVWINHEHTAFDWVSREAFLALPHVPVVDRVFEQMIGPALAS